MDVFGSRFRTLFLLVAALSCSNLFAQDSSGSAYGESVDLTVTASLLGVVSDVVAVESGPLPEVSGATPPNFTESDSAADIDVNASLPILGGLIAVDVLDIGAVEVQTVGTDSPQSDSSAEVVDLDLTLLADQLGLLDLLLLGIGGTNDTVTSSASAAGSCDTGLTTTGDSVLENLVLSGIVAEALGVDGAIVANPDPDTVLVSATVNVPGVVTGDVSIILNEQITSGDGVTSAGITVNAIHVSVDELTLLGLGVGGTEGIVLNGDIIIAQSVAGVTCPQSDLVVTKTDNPDPVFMGDPLSYTVTVVNEGPEDAPNVVMTDTLPPSVSYISATPSQGSCVENLLTVTCDLGLLPARPPGAAGSAFGEYLNLSIDSSLVPASVDVGSGPLPSVSGSAPPAFNPSDSVLSVDESAGIQLGLPGLPATTVGILSTGAINVQTNGDDSTPEANSSATIQALDLTVVEAVPGLLDLFLGISAETVASSASIGGTCGALTTSGETTLTNAALSSDIAGLAGIVGALDVSPGVDTVLFDAAILGGQLRIVLNEQIVTGDGLTSAGITVNAIHITLSGIELPILGLAGQLLDINGEVIIGQSVAQVDCSDTGIATIDFLVTPNQAGVILNNAVVDFTGIDPVGGNNTVQEPTTVLANADLSITKDNGVASVLAGTQTTYTIVASNTGPSAVTGATVSDAFPAELTCSWTCAPTGAASCTAGPVAGDIADTVDIPVGDSVTYSAVCDIDPGASGSLVNTATVTPPDDVTDPDPGNNSATDTDSIGAEADLSLTKDNGSATVSAGEQTTYTIIASNGGPSDAVGAGVSDAFPAELICSWTCVASAGASCTAGPVAGDIADTVDLPAGGSATYTAVCDVSADASGTIANTGTVTPPQGLVDPDPGNNSDTDTDTVLREADLAVTKDNGATSVVAGESTTYTIVASNNGPLDVVGASVVDSFPAAVSCSWTCAPSGGASCTAGPVAGNINDTVDIPVGGTATYTAVCDIDPAASGSLDNTASVTPPQDITDPDTTNNSDSDSDVIERSANLSITKVDDVDPVLAGDTLTYTLTVNNAGPSHANNVTVTDNLPAGVTYVGATPSQGSCSEASLVVTCNLGTVNTGGSATVDIEIIPLQGGQILNSASVGADEDDPDTGDNQDDETTEVTPQADLSLVKVGTPNPVMVGEVLTYTLTVTNNGPSDATGVMLTDNLPASVTFVSVDSSQGSCSEAALVVNCDLGTILTGEDATVTIEVVPNEIGTLNNQASVISDVGDPNPEDNEDDTDVEVEVDNQAYFLVTKDFDDDNPAGVTVEIQCNTGLPLTQQAVVHDPDAIGLEPGAFTTIEFVVNDFAAGEMDCDISEVIPAGYLPGYTAGATTGQASSEFSDEAGCHYTEIQGGAFTCAITNELQPVELIVEKEWIDEHPEYQLPTIVEVMLYCDAPIEPGFPCLGGEGNGGNYCSEQYIQPGGPGKWNVLPHFEGTTCWAVEEPIAGVITDQSDCEEMVVYPGEGDGCVIVNTRVFAGIPTLNQYGLVLLALMMLGMGALAYRRLA